MLIVQKKMLLLEIKKHLRKEDKTRTFFRRNLKGRTEEEIEASIKYGIENGKLKYVKNGYITLHLDDTVIKESDYYGCVEKLLNTHYSAVLKSNENFLISRTARKDTKIAGRWTRPDLTVVTNKKFPYIKETEFDIITFEIKRPSDCEALAIFEALAQNSAATRSYVFFPITENDLALNPQGERIREECARHGIGLFLVNCGYDLSQAQLIIESQRRPLNPERCSQFLQSVLEPSELSRLTTWH